MVTKRAFPIKRLYPVTNVISPPNRIYAEATIEKKITIPSLKKKAIFLIG